MFDDNSRYKKAGQYERQDHRGRTVIVVATPTPYIRTIMGYHLLKQGQRADQLSARYLNDAAGFWKIAACNDAMLPEALSEQPEIAIPNKQ